MRLPRSTERPEAPVDIGALVGGIWAGFRSCPGPPEQAKPEKRKLEDTHDEQH
jgi:hypothetical protein